MYVEERMYRLKIGTAPEYFRHYQSEGMQVQLRQAYLAKTHPLMETQETRIMKCAPFFVERLKTMLAAVK